MTNTPPQGDGLPAGLRYLQGLVIVLMITMILGVITVVWLLVTRMPDGRAQIPALPPNLELPNGQEVQSVTFGPDYSLVVTKTQLLLVYDNAGRLRHQQNLADLPKVD